MVGFLFSLSAVAALYAPAALAALLAGWRWTRGRVSPVGVAVTAGLWLGFLLARPFPVLPVVGAVGWLPFAVLAGLVAGMAAEQARWRRAGTAGLLALALAVTVLVGEAAYNPAFKPPAWTAYAGVAAMGAFSLTRLARIAEAGYTPILLALASFTLAVVAWLYGTRLSLHALTLTAAIAGAAAAARAAGLAWPRSASFAAGAGHFTLAAVMILSNAQFVIPAGASLLLPFASGVAAAISWPKHRPHPGAVVALAAAIAGAGVAAYWAGF